MDIIHGLRETKNSSGHPVLWLHYSADPDKNPATPNGNSWYQEEVKKHYGGASGLKWRSEMEMDFKAGDGELVFPTFVQDEKKIVVDPFPLDDTYVLYGGMDWGTRNPVSFHVYAESLSKKFYAVWEYYRKRDTINEVAEAIRACPFYDRLQWIACDPTMYSETVAKKDGFTSIVEMLMDPDVVGNFTVDKLLGSHGRSDQDGIERVKALWGQADPGLKIFNTCPEMIAEIRNLKYPARKDRTSPTEKILDKNNHAWDELKYFLLSHPFAGKVEQKYQFNTVGYLMRVTDLAQSLANRNGTSVQSEFNNLWGMEI